MEEGMKKKKSKRRRKRSFWLLLLALSLGQDKRDKKQERKGEGWAKEKKSNGSNKKGTRGRKKKKNAEISSAKPTTRLTFQPTFLQNRCCHTPGSTGNLAQSCFHLVFAHTNPVQKRFQVSQNFSLLNLTFAEGFGCCGFYFVQVSWFSKAYVYENLLLKCFGGFLDEILFVLIKNL